MYSGGSKRARFGESTHFSERMSAPLVNETEPSAVPDSPMMDAAGGLPGGQSIFRPER